MLFPPRASSNPPARVVVTGCGIVTALGLDWKSNAEGFRTGRAAFRPVTLFDVSGQRTQQAAEVALPGDMTAPGLSSRKVRALSRASRLLLLAALQAWEQCGWKGGDDLPVVLGTTSGGMECGEAYFRQAIREPARRRNQARRVAHYLCQRQILDLHEGLRIGGPSVLVANACASGANAIGHAWEMVRQGRTQRVLAGGYDALSRLVFAGFDSLQALTPTVCRPFDATRDGLALGEGAAVLALESLASAERRGAEILGEVAGYGAATDVHHLTQPHPEGSAALESMRAACRSAGVTPGQIDYINAHGTGTPLNDSAEAAAIERWAGDQVGSLRVSSTKAGIGHLLGAAGAVETVVCLMALEGQWVPPSTTVRTVDPGVAFEVIRKPTRGRLEYALTNSFGFGGANATLILRRRASLREGAAAGD